MNLNGLNRATKRRIQGALVSTGTQLLKQGLSQRVARIGSWRSGGRPSGKTKKKAYRKPRASAMAQELKCVDFQTPDTADWVTSLSSGSTTAEGLMACNLIRVGASNFERIGREIKLKSLLVNLRFGVGATDGPNVIRVVVVWDTRPEDTMTTWDNIFHLQKNDGSAQLPGAGPLYPPSMATRDRFRILRDERIQINPGVGEAGDYFCRMYVPLKGMKTTFQGTTTTPTLANISTGALYLGVRCTQANSASVSQGDSFVRLRYHE